MKRSFPLLLALTLALGLAGMGCGSKKKMAGGGSSSAGMPPSADPTPAEWSYDTAPAPVFEGSPDYRLMSFGFDFESTILKSEAMGACREAARKLQGKPEARVVAIGFADGIKEKDNAEKLGIERAESARRFLGTLGIEQERVQVASFGAHYSTAKDYETIQQSHERKVELWVLR